MIRSLLAAATALAACACASAPAAVRAETSSTPDAAAVTVLVLGTYHFSNPGMDLVNTTADDVLSPRRQAELEELATRLADFRPTAITVESTRRDENLLAEGYKAFTPADLTTNPDETVQIGYRLASRLGLDRIYAIDQMEGEIDFFPFERVQALAERTGQTDRIAAMIARVQADASAFEEAQKTDSISELLAGYNDPERIERDHQDFYYGLLGLSEGEDHAGAVLNYGWYARNAVIFSNLIRAAKPGDRIVVLYGAGHAYWLRHFVEETPGFTLVEATDYMN